MTFSTAFCIAQFNCFPILEKAKVEQNNVDKVIIDQEKAQDGAKHVKAERSKPNECNKPTMNYGSSLVDVISRINPSSEESEKVEQHPRQKQVTFATTFWNLSCGC